MYQEISIVKKEPTPTNLSISILSITIVLYSRNIVNWTWKVRAIHSERRGDYGENGLGRKLAFQIIQKTPWSLGEYPPLAPSPVKKPLKCC